MDFHDWLVFAERLGSDLGEVDPSGNVTSSRKKDVYGLVRGEFNPNGTSSYKFVGQLGHPSDDNTGLIYMRARYYDPAAGRFASEDAAFKRQNWFVYYSNNPHNRTDFKGTFDPAGACLSVNINVD